MLQSNRVYFFDATEFEEIAQYYIDSGSLRLAYKALEIGEKTTPRSQWFKTPPRRIDVAQQSVYRS